MLIQRVLIVEATVARTAKKVLAHSLMITQSTSPRELPVATATEKGVRGCLALFLMLGVMAPKALDVGKELITLFAVAVFGRALMPVACF